ncbi:MAG: tetratricopeptide repeat protein [Proteobacteria bacterium]|nr:tetratricopeptide repeat protein [Pseudomonadota bacterium]
MKTTRPIPFSRACALAIVLAALGLGVAWPGLARGQESPSQELRARASRYVEEGRALQKNGDYSGAIEKYRAAYDLIPHPQLLYNIGQSVDLSGWLGGWPRDGNTSFWSMNNVFLRNSWQVT